MPAIEKFEITPKQKMACKKIEKAFKEAKKIGLVFLAKSETLCAYRENALEHAIPLHKPFSCWGESIPYYPIYNCILDSGADDEEHFPKGFITE